MENAKKFYDMSMDELASEIAKQKSLVKALERLMETRRAFGEKTTKQMQSSKKKTTDVKKQVSVATAKAVATTPTATPISTASATQSATRY